MLSGVWSAGVTLTVPDNRDGEAVHRVVRGALRESTGVRTLGFALGIAETDDFACYGAPDLISVLFSKTLTEVGDVVFRTYDTLQSVYYAAS